MSTDRLVIRADVATQAPPTLGRTVLFHPRDWLVTRDRPAPWAAIVTAVRDDGLINVHYFAPDGTSGSQRGIRYAQTPDPTVSASWSWPAHA